MLIPLSYLLTDYAFIFLAYDTYDYSCCFWEREFAEATLGDVSPDITSFVSVRLVAAEVTVRGNGPMKTAFWLILLFKLTFEKFLRVF